MSHLGLILAILLASFFEQTQAITNLTMLAFVPFTGNEPRDGQICRAAMQIAVDAVNNNKNLPNFNYLRNYRINVVYKDEGANSLVTIRETINFARTASPNNLIAPAIAGPYFSAGCQRLAAMLQYVDMISVATGCSASIFSGNRRQYPNLYHTRAQAEIIAYSRVQFIKQIGKWDRVAILTSATSARDVAGAVLMQDLLQQQGITVPWFDAVLEVDSATTLMSLKQSDLRVILLETTLMDPAVRFLCASYRYGITGRNYLFLLQTTVMFELNSQLPKYPPGCTKGILVEQTRYTLYIGIFFFSTHETSNAIGKTTFGYDYDNFEELLQAKQRRPWDSGDYVTRHLCHDAMLEALIALENGDHMLGEKFNLSLADYQNGAKNTELVFRAVNQSAASIDFVGLRVGRQRYSKRLELDNEPLSVMQWLADQQSFTHAYVIKHNESMEYHEQDSYSLVELRPLLWETASKEPPKSFPPTVVTFTTRNNGYSIFIMVDSCLLTIFQIVVFLLTNCRQKPTSKSKLLLDSALLLGCLLANAAAIMFAQGNDWFCWLQIFFAVLAITVLNCNFLAKILLFYSVDMVLTAFFNYKAPVVRPTNKVVVDRTKSYSISTIPRTTSTGKLLSPMSSSSVNKARSGRRKRFTMSCLALFFAANFILLTCWLGTDLPKPNSINISIKYNDEMNIYEQQLEMQCVSEFFWRWTGVYSALNCLSFAIGCMMSYAMWHHQDAAKGLRLFTIAQLNMATLLGAVFLVTLLIKWPTWQSAIEATAAIVISASSFVLTIARPDAFKTANTIDHEIS